MLARTDANQKDTARPGFEGGIDQSRVDAIGVDEDEKVTLAEPLVGDDHLAVAGRALDCHGAQSPVGEQRSFV